MEKLYFGTNLKMYKNIRETTAYLDELTERTKDLGRKEMELFVIPSYTSLPDAVKIKNRALVQLGAQNMGWEEQGQFTGEISPLMLTELGLDLVMVGHSERRHVFRETDYEENRKVLCALQHGLAALLCVGETAEEKDYGIADEVLRRQLIAGFHGISKDRAKALTDGACPKLRVAYEPVWAIGVHGKPASVAYAQEKHRVIKECLAEIFGAAGAKVPVLYGGSVNPDNAEALIAQPAVDGLFVGRSAWQAEVFDKLIRAAIESARQ